MSWRDRLILYFIVAVPIPVLSGIYFGFNWEVYGAWVAMAVIFTLIEISQRWKR